MDLWPSYANIATPAEGQNAEPGDPHQKMFECVYATTAVCLMALGYTDTEPTDLMNLVHPGGHAGGEDYGVVTAFLKAHPERWPNLPPIELVNPNDTIAHLKAALAQGFAIQMDCKDDANARPVQRFGAWKGTHSVIVTGDEGGIQIWDPWTGGRQTYSEAFWRAATTNEAGLTAGNFMVFQRDLRLQGGDDLTPTEQRMLQTIYDKMPLVDLIFRAVFDQPDPTQPARSTHGLPTDIRDMLQKLPASAAGGTITGTITGTIK